MSTIKFLLTLNYVSWLLLSNVSLCNTTCLFLYYIQIAQINLVRSTCINLSPSMSRHPQYWGKFLHNQIISWQTVFKNHYHGTCFQDPLNEYCDSFLFSKLLQNKVLETEHKWTTDNFGKMDDKPLFPAVTFHWSSLSKQTKTKFCILHLQFKRL